MNPFIIQGYRSKEFFCDRVNETTRITNALKNGNNVTLISGRRKGKSNLIHHILNNHFEHFAYVDIYDVESYQEFSIKLSEEIIKQYGKPTENFLKRISHFLTGLKPVFSFDSISGEPQILLQTIENSNPKTTIEEVFKFLKSEQKEIVIAIDEFQEILNWDKKAEALLRGLIQLYPEIRFIFSGSNRHLMLEMFTNKKRPFYHSSELLILEKINQDLYFDFIKGFLNQKFKNLQDDIIRIGIDWCRGETYYIQRWFNRLYSLDKLPKIELYEEEFYQFILEKESEFQHQLDLFPKTQKDLLKAIARNVGVIHPTGKEFTRKYNLATSSVNQNLSILIEKDMIEKVEGKYVLTDVFMDHWLRKL